MNPETIFWLVTVGYLVVGLATARLMAWVAYQGPGREKIELSEFYYWVIIWPLVAIGLLLGTIYWLFTSHYSKIDQKRKK